MSVGAFPVLLDLLHASTPEVAYWHLGDINRLAVNIRYLGLKLHVASRLLARSAIVRQIRAISLVFYYLS